MTEYRFPTASAALPHLMDQVLQGDETGSRAGRVKEILHPHIVLTNPTRREILIPGRRASLPAQIAETMWVLAGRDDIAWLERYLPRAPDFSDDGKTWRGAYGARLRSWGGEIDQLEHVVNLLKQDPLTRRAVMSIYDPARDSQDGKDIPCNDFIQFQSRLGKLHMHVFTRSNDLMWGWSGINAFEWSVLQEVVAGLLGINVGELHFSISNLHLYDRHWNRAERIAYTPVPLTFSQPSPRFKFTGDLWNFDQLVDDWLGVEETIREGNYGEIESFSEPMLRSWLRVIAWHWSGNQEFLKPLEGCDLYAAALQSPEHDIVKQAPETRIMIPWDTLLEVYPDPFTEFVVDLHARKSAVYGDSWKRRGEAGILGNIARKIDRLGVAGGGDTAADTAIDLLVYLVKYDLWLEGRDNDDRVAEVLRSLTGESVSVEEMDRQEQWLVASFAKIETEEYRAERIRTVNLMIPVAASVARRLWLDENHAARNATRSWNPDA
jgi:thymidylate synthase